MERVDALDQERLEAALVKAERKRKQVRRMSFWGIVCLIPPLFVSQMAVVALLVFPVLGVFLLLKYQDDVKKIIMPVICEAFQSEKLSFVGNDSGDAAEKIRRAATLVYGDKSVDAVEKVRKEASFFSGKNDRNRKVLSWSLTDVFRGEYEGRRFMLAEGNVTKVNRGARLEPFKGLVIYVESGKEPAVRTEVVVRRDSTVLFSHLPRVHLEDPLFEKLFNVYGSDQIGARRILTPKTMASVLTLSEFISAGMGLKKSKRKSKVSRGSIPEFAVLKEGAVMFIPTSYDLFEFPDPFFGGKIDKEKTADVLSSEIKTALKLVDFIGKNGLA